MAPKMVIVSSVQSYSQRHSSDGDRLNFKEGRSPDRDELILLTPQKSDDGVVMKALQRAELRRPEAMRPRMFSYRAKSRSHQDRPNFKEGPSPDRDELILPTPQKSDYRGWMKDNLRSMEGIITFQEEPSSPWDVMNLPTALQAVVGGGM
ncbi:uncharacterized protein AB9X84_021848 isoform 1-T2 [Acanthopagrus schlegelii]